MNDVVNFLFYKSWADKLESLDDKEYSKDMLYRIMRYGIYKERDLDGLGPMDKKWLEEVYHSIDVAKNNYAEKQAKGGNGRPLQYDHSNIYQLLCATGNAAEVGRQLKMKGDSIYKTKEYIAWRNDGKPTYPEKVLPESLPVKDIPEPEEIPEKVDGKWVF